MDMFAFGGSIVLARVDELECPVGGLDQKFPDMVVVLHDPPTQKYACFCYHGVHGLACFTSRITARDFVSKVGFGEVRNVEVTFNEAREIAKMRPLPVVSLMLLDNILNPKIHYVR